MRGARQARRRRQDSSLQPRQYFFRSPMNRLMRRASSMRNSSMFSGTGSSYATSGADGALVFVIFRRLVCRMGRSPGNLTLDTLSDLLLGISAEEFNAASSKLLNRPPRNYSHWEKLASLSEQSTMTRMNAMSATKAATSQMSIQPTASALDALKNRPQVFDNAAASIAIISNQAIQTSSDKMGIQ